MIPSKDCDRNRPPIETRFVRCTTDSEGLISLTLRGFYLCVITWINLFNNDFRKRVSGFENIPIYHIYADSLNLSAF